MKHIPIYQIKSLYRKDERCFYSEDLFNTEVLLNCVNIPKDLRKKVNEYAFRDLTTNNNPKRFQKIKENCLNEDSIKQFFIAGAYSDELAKAVLREACLLAR